MTSPWSRVVVRPSFLRLIQIKLLRRDDTPGKADLVALRVDPKSPAI
jgi:hypothetical protein